MKNDVISRWKSKLRKIKVWILRHPKEVFRYSIIIVFISFVLSILQYFLFPPKFENNFLLPDFFSQSDKQIESSKLSQARNEKEMKGIVDELKSFRNKRDNQILTNSDSIRIEYLYNQYEKLKNGH